MNMKKYLHFHLLVAFLVLCLSGAAYAQDASQADFRQHPFYVALNDTAFTADTPDEVADKIYKEAITTELQEVSILWIDDNIVSGKLSPKLALANAELLREKAKRVVKSGDREGYNKIMDSVVTQFFLFEILAHTDKLRCADATAGAHIYDLIRTKSKIIDTYYLKSSHSHRFYMIHQALTIADWHKDRAPNPWACQGGKTWPANAFKRDPVWQKLRDKYIKNFAQEKTS